MWKQRTVRATLFFRAAEAFHETCWQPAADVYRTPAGWLVKFELAGVRPADLTLQLLGNRLILQGVRRDWQIEAGCRYHALEIAYSRFERHLDLPVDLEHSPITTEYEAGMLLVHLRTEEGKR